MHEKCTTFGHQPQRRALQNVALVAAFFCTPFADARAQSMPTEFPSEAVDGINLGGSGLNIETPGQFERPAKPPEFTEGNLAPHQPIHRQMMYAPNLFNYNRSQHLQGIVRTPEERYEHDTQEQDRNGVSLESGRVVVRRRFGKKSS